jgi:hypothetical protein
MQLPPIFRTDFMMYIGAEKIAAAMKYDKSRFKVWKWYHPLVLHWMINPGLAINELVFGQKVPRIMLIERNPEKPLSEKSFVPCPHCNTLHPGMKWSAQNGTAFKNWFGLYCDQCGKIIPCAWNITSLLILAATFPLWIGFRSHFKTRWLQKQKARFAKPILLSSARYNWIQTGMVWAFCMFVFMELVFPFISGEPLTLRRVLIGMIVWTLAGFAFAYPTKWFLGRRKPGVPSE